MYRITKLREDLYALSYADRETRFFEASREIAHEGIYYHSYVLFAPEGAVVVDGRKKGLDKEFFEALSEVVELKDIKAVIVNHSEPDHSGTIPELLKRTGATLYAHPFAVRLIKNFYELARLDAVTVKDGSVHKIAGDEFKFIHVPRMHWPDTIVTMRKDVRFTGDVFGSYYVYSDPVYSKRKEKDPDTGEDVDIEELFLEEAAEYFATVIGTYRTRGTVLSKLQGKPRILAPAHGLIRTENVEYPIELYKRLVAGEPLKPKRVLLLCSSMYGFTLAIKEAARRVLEDKGYEVVEFCYSDREHPRIPDILGNFYSSSAVVLVTSAYEAELHPRIRYVLSLVAKKVPPRKIFVLMSLGRGAAFPKDMQERLEKAGFELKINRFSLSMWSEGLVEDALSEL